MNKFKMCLGFPWFPYHDFFLPKSGRFVASEFQGSGLYPELGLLCCFCAYFHDVCVGFPCVIHYPTSPPFLDQAQCSWNRFLIQHDPDQEKAVTESE